MDQYKLIRKKGEGTFSEVLEANHLPTNQHVALKCMKNNFKDINEVNKLREIQALKKLSPHENIVDLLEILYNKDGQKLALVFEQMDMNLYDLISGAKTYIPTYRIKYILFQVLKAIYHMHKNGIFHRDIKPENILVKGDDIKLADFGCCKGVFAEPPYTEYISTRWYRPPECLQTDGFYDSKIDIWGIGCVLYEVISQNPLFPGDDELDQINKIHAVLGTPDPEVLNLYQQLATHMDFDFKDTVGCGLESLIGECSSDCLDILKKLLAYEPHKRISAGEALRHEYFSEILEKEMEREFEKSLRYTSISNLNQINYYETRQNSNRKDDNGKDYISGLGLGLKNRYPDRSRTYSKPLKFKQQSQASEVSNIDESFEYRNTIKLPNISNERGGSFEYNSTRNSIKTKLLSKSKKFAFAVKSPKKPFGKAKSTIKYVLEGKRIGL